MKKTIAWILALAMLSTSAMALAREYAPADAAGRKRTAPGNAEWQKPGNPPDSRMGGPGGQSGKPDSYDAVTTVSTDTEISGETIESTGKDESALVTGWHDDGDEFNHRSRFRREHGRRSIQLLRRGRGGADHRRHSLHFG